MEGGYALTITSRNVTQLQVEQSVQEDGICVCTATSTHRIPPWTTTRTRTRLDDSRASRSWSSAVCPLKTALLGNFLQDPAVSQPVSDDLACRAASEPTVRTKQCICPLVTIDLTEHEDLLWEWLANEYVIGAFMAPPCGSASKARAIPLRGKKRRLNSGLHGPRPLRSDRHPNGLPNLNFAEAARILIANQLYHLTAKEFMRMAIQAGHLASLESFLPMRLSRCITAAFGMSSANRMRHRTQTLKFWLKRSLELKEPETQLHEALHPNVAAVLKGKRILLWEEMLKAIKYGDMGVVDEFKRGATLTVPAEVTGLWPKKFTPANLTASALLSMAKEQRKTLTCKHVVFFEEEVAMAVWEQTMEEVSKGEIEGPIDLAEVPLHYPLSKRFGVSQGQKI
eukprot:s3673_g1.t1